MNISLCTDEKFVIPCLTCITSILENNKDEMVHIYVLTSCLPESEIKKFHKLAALYGQEITVTKIDINKVKGLKTCPPFPISMYFRFLLPEILNNQTKVLYLDCDIIVRHSLRDLYKTDLTGFSCAAVEDQHADDILLKNNTRTQSPYFNSGVLLMNLDYWRKHNIAYQLIKFIHDNPERCIYPDQDALNIVLDGIVTYLPYSYNFQHYWSVNFHMAKISRDKHPAIKEAGKNPCIVHFCKEKPWWTICHNPYTSEFDYFNRLHSFIGKANSHKRIKEIAYRLFNRLSMIMEGIRDKFKI